MFRRNFLRRWFGPRPGTIRKSTRKQSSLQVKPQLEELETRLVLTANVSLTAGVLRAVCDNAATTVTLGHSGTTTTLNGKSFADSRISRIEILGGAGKDTIKILDTTANKPVVVKSGGGNDIIHVGNAANLLSGIQGVLTVDGGAGVDSLMLHDNGSSVGRTYTFAAGSVSRSQAARINFSSVTEALTLDTGGGGDKVQVQDTPAGNPVVVRTGAGNDVIQIGNTANPASVRSALTVDAGAGNDVIRVDNASAASQLVLRAGVGMDMTYIHAAAARSVTVNDPTANGETGWVYVGGSPLNLTGSTANVTGAVHISSAPGVYVADSADVIGTITLDRDAAGNGRVAGLTTVPITYGAGQVNELFVNRIGQGGNTFWINNPAARDYTSIGTGFGDDKVNVLATTTDLYSVNFGGRDTFTLGSKGPAGGGTTANIGGDVLFGDETGAQTDLVVDNSSDVVGRRIALGDSSAGLAEFGATASITGVSPGEIGFWSVASVTIRGGAHDTFTQLRNYDFPIEFQDGARVTATFDTADGILRIEGTGNADTIRIVQGSDDTISLDGMTITYIDGQTVSKVNSLSVQMVSRVEVQGHGGDDQVIFDDSRASGSFMLPVSFTGSEGNDTLVGGRGNDSMWGSAGADSIDGGAGADILFGGDGNDTLWGSAGADTIDGEAGDDDVSDRGNNDELAAYFDRKLSLRSLGDFLNVGGRNEKWVVGNGWEWYFITPDGGFYRHDGGGTATGALIATFDTSFYDDVSKLYEADSGPRAYHLDKQLGLHRNPWGEDLNRSGMNEKWIYGDGKWPYFITPDGKLYRDAGGNTTSGTLVATLDPSYYADVSKLTEASVWWTAGQSDNDRLEGGTGNDTLDSGAGDDTLLGGAGNDDLWGGLGDNTIYGGAGIDYISGDAGNDYLVGGDGHESDDDILFGDVGNDTLYGGGGNDLLRSDDGDDSLFGEGGNDYLEGGAGRDSMYGQEGNDTLYGGDNQGSSLGQDLADYLDGGADNDGLFGGYRDGWDTLIGGAGADRFLVPLYNDGSREDVVTETDKAPEDALISFYSGIASWTNAEIIAVDQGLAGLGHGFEQ